MHLPEEAIHTAAFEDPAHGIGYAVQELCSEFSLDLFDKAAFKHALSINHKRVVFHIDQDNDTVRISILRMVDKVVIDHLCRSLAY